MTRHHKCRVGISGFEAKQKHMQDMGPYVSTANPPLSDYIIQYNSQPQRTNQSFRMKAKSKCMGKQR